MKEFRGQEAEGQGESEQVGKWERETAGRWKRRARSDAPYLGGRKGQGSVIRIKIESRNGNKMI